MKLKNLLLLSIIFWAGCAAYKELQPEPPISYFENGYIELMDDDEFFELDEGKKYFLPFPQPQNENTYLVLKMTNKAVISSYLTRAFDDGKGAIIKMPDESEDRYKLSLYQLDKTVPTFYWVIEEVRKDIVLEMTYRYVAIWRYKFETKHAQFEKILTDNTQDRSLFNSIGKTIFAQDIDYDGERISVQNKLEKIQQVKSQLNEIEEIFPPEIIDSPDESYQTYLRLKNDIDTEIQFQSDYLTVLSIFKSAVDPQSNIRDFVMKAAEYIEFLNQEEKYPNHLLNEAKDAIASRLPEVTPYFEMELRKKNNIDMITLDNQSIENLYGSCGQIPDAKFQALSKFINLFNQRSEALSNVQNKLDAIKNEVQKNTRWPSNTFYTDIRARLSKLKYALPKSDIDSFGIYRSYVCTSLLNKAIKNTRSEMNSLEWKYKRSEELVPQINMLKNQGRYNDILRILKQNPDLTFLRAQYSDLDQLSLTQQKMAINESLRNKRWSEAEFRIRDLHLDKNFLNMKDIGPIKDKLVRSYEDTLLARVEAVSIQNATEHINAYKDAYENIDDLYADSIFKPVHKITFTSGSQSELVGRNQVLENRMSFLKHEKFPETAIQSLYRSFSQAIHDNGVAKARAIVTHSTYYKGQDRKIKNLIAECDPTAAKWITKPKQYRKIYALPITTNLKGINEYMVKLNIQIKSEAKFPVYDINVKLPREIARHAGKKQWYDRITFNKKLLKNEGRFTISSPTEENDFEAQITPLQVNKTGDNVLEIRFKYDSFKVFEVSIMAQKPIIKKN